MLKYIAPYRILVITSIVCAAVSVASQLYVPILTGDAIDYMIYRNNVNFDGVVRKTCYYRYCNGSYLAFPVLFVRNQ